MVLACRARFYTPGFLLLIVFLTSCSAHKAAVSNSQARRNNSSVERSNREAISNYTTFTVASYIERFKKIAVKEMDLYGIPAVVSEN